MFCICIKIENSFSVRQDLRLAMQHRLFSLIVVSEVVIAEQKTWVELACRKQLHIYKLGHA